MAKGSTEYEMDMTKIGLADLVAALKTLKGDDDDTLKRKAQFEAEALNRLQKRENPEHPGISAYNPKGEAVPDLRCPMFWLGSKLETRVLTVEEISLLNRVEQVGESWFTRADGSRERITVTGERDANGAWQKLAFDFDARGDKKHNLPSMVSILRELLQLGTVEDELRRELAELRALVA